MKDLKYRRHILTQDIWKFRHNHSLQKTANKMIIKPFLDYMLNLNNSKNRCPLFTGTNCSIFMLDKLCT